MTSPQGLKICVDNNRDERTTDNIVYKDMLNNRLDKQMTPMSVHVANLRNLPNRGIDSNDAPFQRPIDAPSRSRRAPSSRAGQNCPSVLRGSNAENIEQPSTSNNSNSLVRKTPSMLQADQHAMNNGIEHRSIIETEGDGNCWFHANVDQFLNDEIRDTISDRAKNVNPDHLSLRFAIADYCENDEELNNSAKWNNLKFTYLNDLILDDPNFRDMTPEQVWQAQLTYIRTPGTGWAKDIFIDATAFFFEKDIILYHEHHHHTFRGSLLPDDQIQTQPFEPIRIAHLNGNHFQSLRLPS